MNAKIYEGTLCFIRQGESGHGKWWTFKVGAQKFFVHDEEQARKLQALEQEYVECFLTVGANALEYTGEANALPRPSRAELIQREITALQDVVHLVALLDSDEVLGLTGDAKIKLAWQIKSKIDKKLGEA